MESNNNEKKQDPSLCKTIQYLKELECKELNATSKSLNQVYDKNVHNIVDKFKLVVENFTDGRVIGELIVVVFYKLRSAKSKTPRYQAAEVVQWRMEEKMKFPASKNNSLMILHVRILFANMTEGSSGALERSGHSAMIVVDPEHSTIEYSDPHGNAVWNTLVYDGIKHSMDNAFPGYAFLPPWQTCPNLGVQSLLNEGLCQLFSSMYAFIRLRCPHVSPLELQSYLVSLGHRRLRELTAGWFCLLLS